MEKLVIIDGNSIIYRAFFALPPLSNSAGLHTNAVYGFTTMLLKLLEEEKPTHMLVAFDAGKVTFRHEGYADYKGGREKTPPELSEQFPLLKDLLRSFSIAQYEREGYEADDIIGTLTRIADGKGMKVTVVSGDKDMLQLASDRVTVALTRKGISEVERFDPAHIRETYGLSPLQIIDLKGLMGDTSDNIPGIPGVGEKTALKLLHEYGSVEEVLANAGGIKGKLGEKIREHAEDAAMSKKLATIFREVPEVPEWEALAYGGYEGPSLQAAFRKLEFKSLLEKMDFSGGGAGESGESEIGQAEEVAPLEVAIVDESRLGELIEALPGIEAIHVEGVGENPHQADVLGIAFFSHGSEPAAGYYVPVDTLLSDKAERIRAWLEDAEKPKLIYDLHKAEVALAWRGLALRGVRFDVLLAAYLLDPTDSALSLDGIVRKYQLQPLHSDEEVFGKGAKFQVPELSRLADYLCRKALAVHRLTPLMERDLEANGMHRLYYDLEHPLAGVLASMELKGIKVDGERLRGYGDDLAGKLVGIMQNIYDHAGMEFNINSPKQLGEVLFEKLGLPVWKKTKTGPSTDAEVLEKLAPYHDIVKEILLYRQLAKLQSTYVEGLLKEINEKTGKVHTYYRQTIAATGRLSSQFPNLQNIPIRLEEGRKIRQVFVPSEPDWLIFTADYSQIELRVLAHISGDERLKEAFLNDMDIHTKTAMDVFGVSADQVDANMRRQAKAVNFGIVYGISDYGLSVNLDITRKEAANFIEQYFAVFQGVRKYMDDIVQSARMDGYVTTLLQRRRFLPEINASNFNLRSFAERTAMNTPIQGTAADIIKLAMVQMAQRLADEGLKSRMLLQVHDELVFEVPPEELETMKRIVPEVMENAIQLDVPLKVEADYGSNWYEAK